MSAQKGFVPVLIILLIAVAALAGGFWIYQSNPSIPPSPSPSPVACTQDAKLCPDGTAVGRIGPNCAFAPCPTPESTSSADMTSWKTYKNTNIKYEIKYPDQLQLVERDFGGGYIVVVITDMKLAEGTTYPVDSESLVPAEYTQGGGDSAIYKGFILDIRPIFNVNQNFDIMVATKSPPIRINNANVYKTNIGIFKKNNFQSGSAYAVMINDSKSHRYDLSVSYNADKKEYLPIFDQILSTFKFLPEQSNNEVCPTTDLKRCPDGSYVGRTGPDCTFICQ